MTFTTKLLIDNYINAYDVDGKFWYYDLMFAPGGMDSNNTEIETEASRYVIGYLATLYLSDPAVRYNYDNKASSVKVVDSATTVDALKLPEGSHPSRSILEDFNVYFTSLIDQSKKESSNCMTIINSNDMIPSTVKSDTAYIGAGKSNPDKAKATGTAAADGAVAAADEVAVNEPAGSDEGDD